MHDALWSILECLLLEPFAAIVVCTKQTAAGHVVKRGHFGQRALQLGLRQVERKIVDLLLGIFKSLQQQTDLAKVSLFKKKAQTCQHKQIIRRI